MATHCMIIVKVPKEMIGTTISFDPNKIPEANPFEDFESSRFPGGTKPMNTNVELCSQPVLLDKPYIAIYNHWDGDSVGEVLKEHFNTLDLALNLIAAGHCSAVCDHVVPYCSRKDEKWEEVKPYIGKTMKDIPLECFNYVFSNGKWR